MKNLWAILAAVGLAAIPVGLYGQVQTRAGLLDIGAHLDVVYRYSAESNNNPGSDEVYWSGYESLNAETMILALSGTVNEQLSWEFNNAFGWPVWTQGVPDSNFALMVLDANMKWRIVDPLGLIIGRQLVPTLLCNGPHSMAVLHTANFPLVLTGGYNAAMVSPPTYQTGIGLELNFADFYINTVYYNGELVGGNALPGGNDTGSEQDPDKMKGWNTAIGYSGEVGPGKLKARGFYFQESSDLNQTEPEDDSSIAGYGLSAIYDAKIIFVGAEFMSATRDPEDEGAESVTQYGYYGLVGGRISSVELAFRYDFVDYTNQSNADYPGAEDTNTETWYTFAINYLINEDATIGIDYVLKYPEAPEDTDYPNINEISVIAELDLL